MLRLWNSTKVPLMNLLKPKNEQKPKMKNSARNKVRKMMKHLKIKFNLANQTENCSGCVDADQTILKCFLTRFR